MNFEFAKYTEVTDLAFKVNDQYKAAGYTRLFLCPDINDVQIVRVLPGWGMGYEKNPSAIIVEHNKTSNSYKGESITLGRAEKILREDDFSNWDYHVFPDDMEQVISSIDGGFGVLNLQAEAT